MHFLGISVGDYAGISRTICRCTGESCCKVVTLSRTKNHRLIENPHIDISLRDVIYDFLVKQGIQKFSQVAFLGSIFG